MSHLLVDGEIFGSARVFYSDCVHGVVAKHLQRASNVKFLVDDLMRKRNSLMQ